MPFYIIIFFPKRCQLRIRISMLYVLIFSSLELSNSVSEFSYVHTLILMEGQVGTMHEADDVLHGSADCNYTMTRYRHVHGTSRTANRGMICRTQV